MTDLNVGDKVSTNFNSRISHHEVTKVDRSPKTACESGILVKVNPFLGYRDEWIDSNWFKKQ